MCQREVWTPNLKMHQYFLYVKKDGQNLIQVLEILCIMFGSWIHPLHFMRTERKLAVFVMNRTLFGCEDHYSMFKENHLFCLVFSGSWSIQFERGSGLVTLRSLHWLGFSFYHVPNSRKYGSIYFGLGTKNLDLPFML